VCETALLLGRGLTLPDWLLRPWLARGQIGIVGEGVSLHHKPQPILRTGRGRSAHRTNDVSLKGRHRLIRALIVTPQISERVDPYAGISPHPAPKAVSDTASRRRRAGIVGPTTVGMRYEVSKIFSEQQNHRKEDGDLTSTLA
jgi:hypothetical protein